MNAFNHEQFYPTEKRAKIDDEERRLIDEAIAAGRVQTIPQGKSALAEEYVWQGDRSHYGVGNLVPKNPLTRAEALAKFKAHHNPPRQKNPAVAHRQAEVLRLTEEGYTESEITAALKKVGINCSSTTVKNDRAQLKKKGKLGNLSSGANGVRAKALEDRRQRVLGLIQSGMSNPEVAAELGITHPAVISDRKNLIQRGLLKKAVGGRILP